jgi:hypothetical protein
MIHPEYLLLVQQQHHQERLQAAAQTRLLRASRDVRATQKSRLGNWFTWEMHQPRSSRRHTDLPKHLLRWGTKPCCPSL